MKTAAARSLMQVLRNHRKVQRNLMRVLRKNRKVQRSLMQVLRKNRNVQRSLMKVHRSLRARSVSVASQKVGSQRNVQISLMQVLRMCLKCQSLMASRQHVGSVLIGVYGVSCRHH